MLWFLNTMQYINSNIRTSKNKNMNILFILDLSKLLEGAVVNQTLSIVPFHPLIKSCFQGLNLGTTLLPPSSLGTDSALPNSTSLDTRLGLL